MKVINRLFPYATYFRVCPTCSNGLSNVFPLLSIFSYRLFLSFTPLLVQSAFSHYLLFCSQLSQRAAELQYISYEKYFYTEL